MKNAFELMAKITLDTKDYESNLNDAEQKTSGFAGKLKAGLPGAAKVAMAGVAALGTGIVAVGKKAIDSYANYEQLVGGVETLFKDSSGTVQGYAQQAYKTAGLSANAYMETITGFSASLLQSLDGDTAKAAEVGNMAVTDMSDNANKMGTSMESIQYAYQGFAKQNYTMLDNLKLGYGGTKSEMERLIADANRVKEANGEMGNLSIESFADVTEAIHIMQTEIGITGTTAKEANETISGSVGMVKGAWENLLTGFADGSANMPELLGNLADSVGTAVHNIVPRIVTVFPQIVEAGAQLVSSLMNGLSSNTDSIIKGVLNVVTSLISVIATHAPEIIVAGYKLVTQLAIGLVNAIPDIVSKIPGIIKQIVTSFASGYVEMVEVGVNLVKGLWNGIKNVEDWIVKKVKGFGKKVLKSIKSFFGIHSPSKVMEKEVGENISLGIAKGITDGAGAVLKSTNDLNKNMLAGVTMKAPEAAQTATTTPQTQGSRDIVINITSELDGSILARKLYRYNLNEIDRKGLSLVGV